MSRRGQSQRVMDDDFLRAILMPAYYRHEFARRNEAVLMQSKTAMRAFRMTASLVEEDPSFLKWDGDEPVTLVDDLMGEYRQEPDKQRKSAMLESLGAYAQNQRVLPVLPPPSPFFPKEMGYKFVGAGKHGEGSGNPERMHKGLIATWRSLIDFERFLLAEGMTNEPCFMPVVPLNKFQGTLGVHDASPERIGRVSEHRLLVALDGTQALECLANNFEMLLDHLDALDMLRGKAGETGRDSERMPWKTFDLYLQVLDFLKDKATKSDKELADEFYKMTNRPLETRQQFEAAVINFKTLKKTAKTWADEYRKIT